MGTDAVTSQAPTSSGVSFDFSPIPGHQEEAPTIGAPQDPTALHKLSQDSNLGQRSNPLDIGQDIEKLTEPIENYTQEGRKEHPILSKIGDVTRGVKELLEGGQAAGKPMGTSSGVATNPVTNAVAMAPDAAEVASKVVPRVADQVGEVGRTFARSLIEEGKAALEAKHPEGSLEAGFAKIPGHKKLLSAPEPPEPEKAGNKLVADSAQRYNSARSQPPINHEPVELPPQESRNKMADDLDHAKHEPKNPAVARSYDAMKKETLDQFNHAKNDLGIKFDFTKDDPYKTAQEMQADVKNNHHLATFTGGNPLPADHPLAEVEPSTGQTYNDIFRATHDIYGHGAGGHDFSEAGEENAYNAHKQMYSPEARPAVQNETQGQSNWYFNSAKARAGAEKDFPEQKATIIPESGQESPNADIPESQQEATPEDSPETGYHPTLDAIAKKHGLSESEYGTKNGASFIAPDGKFVHLNSIEHGAALHDVSGSSDWKPFLEESGAIRTRYTFGKGGHEFHITVPKQGVTPEQVDALKKSAFHTLGKGGNIFMERTDLNPENKDLSQNRWPANANAIEPMLKDIQAHPDQKWHAIAAKKAADPVNGIAGGIDPRTGLEGTKGKGAEIFPEKRQALDHIPTQQDFKDFYETNKDLFDKHPEFKIGWDNGSNAPGGHEINIAGAGPGGARVAKKLDQVSAWDIEKQEPISTGGKGLRREFTNYPVEDRIKDLNDEPLSDRKGFEHLSKDAYGDLDSDTRAQVKDNTKLQRRVMKEYHSRVPSAAGNASLLITKPLDITGTGESQRVTVLDTGKALGEWTKNNLQRTPTIQDAIEAASAETQHQLAQENSGLEWYKKDVGDAMDKVQQKEFPQLSQPVKRQLFTAIWAPMSYGTDPDINMASAIPIFRGYEQTGKFPLMQESGKHWPGRTTGHTANLSNLQRLINEKGEDGAMNWMLTKHPISEVRQYASKGGVSGKAADEKYGAFIYGPKGGPFFLNLNGISDHTTVDVWGARAIRRWMGEGPRLDADGEELGPTPTEQERFHKVNDAISQKYKIDKGDGQAVLWFFEHELYKVHGAGEDAKTYSGAVEKYYGKRGNVQSPGDAEESPAASQGREDAPSGGSPQNSAGAQAKVRDEGTMELSEAKKLKDYWDARGGQVKYEPSKGKAGYYNVTLTLPETKKPASSNQKASGSWLSNLTGGSSSSRFLPGK